MKNIVRILFGDLNEPIKTDIDFLLSGEVSKHNSSFITYVFGRRNLDYLQERGLECRLVSPDNWIYPEVSQQLVSGFRWGNKYVLMHKLVGLKQAADELGEIVFLDWDCIPFRRLPADFWGTLQEGGPFQVPLYWWPEKVSNMHFPGLWECRNIFIKEYSFSPMTFYPLPNAGFVYLRDKHIAAELLEIAETLPPNILLSDENAMGIYIDRQMDGKFSIERYMNEYEPTFCHGAVAGQLYGEQSVLASYVRRENIGTPKRELFWHLAGSDTIRGYKNLTAHQTAPDPKLKSRSLYHRLKLLLRTVILYMDPKCKSRPLYLNLKDRCDKIASKLGCRPL